MNFKQAEGEIIGYFNTQINGAVPISWPNVPFTLPADGSWVRFTMKNNDGRQVTMGSPGANRYRRIGIVTIQVFRKIKASRPESTSKVLELADTVADIFIANQLNGILFKNVNARDVGNDGNGWYQYNVTAEFQYDRIT